MEEKRKKRGVGRWIILAIVVWAVGSGTLAGRSWTTTEGEEFEADLVRYKNGIVILKKSEGGNTMLSLGKLSGADQEYVREKYPEGDRKEAERVRRQARPAPKPAPQSREAPPAMQGQPERRQPQGPTSYLKELNPGDLAPEVIGRLPKSGEKIELTKLKGTLVLIDFFSIQNQRTRKEMPAVVAAYRKYGGKGFEIIGVTLDSDYRSLYKFKQAYGGTWSTTTDKYKRLVNRWGVVAIPTRVLVDQNGYILKEHVHAHNLDATIQKYLRRRR